MIKEEEKVHIDSLLGYVRTEFAERGEAVLRPDGRSR